MMYWDSPTEVTGPALKAPAAAFTASVILHVLILLAPLELWSRTAPGEGRTSISAVIAPPRIATSTAANARLLLAAHAQRSTRPPLNTAVAVERQARRVLEPEFHFDPHSSSATRHRGIKDLPGDISAAASIPALKPLPTIPSTVAPDRKRTPAPVRLLPAPPPPDLASAAATMRWGGIKIRRQAAATASRSINTRTATTAAQNKRRPSNLSTDVGKPRGGIEKPAGRRPETTAFQAARFDSSAPHNRQPRYPESARMRGIQGRVFLEVRVNPRGKPDNVRIKASSGFKVLDRAALKAVRRWHFQPALKNGSAVSGMVVVPVNFKLTG